MVCLGVEPGAAGWKVQTNPLSYGGTPLVNFLHSSGIGWNDKSITTLRGLTGR